MRSKFNKKLFCKHLQYFQVLKENIWEALRSVVGKFHYNYNSFEFLEHKLAGKRDSFYDPAVQNLIVEGLTLMSSSKDPFHDVSHILRCISLAKVYFSGYRLTHKLDWGTLLTAIVYHDMARTKKIGMLYEYKSLKFFEKLPLVVDLTLIKYNLRDAENSCKIFKDLTKNSNLNQKFLADVQAGILGTTLRKKKFSDKMRKNIYFQLIGDIDFLDMFSIGRFEKGVTNTRFKKMASLKYFNRAICLVSVRKKRRDPALNLAYSRPILETYEQTLRDFGGEFYPVETEKYA